MGGPRKKLIQDVNHMNSDIPMAHRGIFTQNKIYFPVNNTLEDSSKEPTRKHSLSIKTMEENMEQAKSHKVLTAVAGSKLYGELNCVSNINTEAMLDKVAKDLKRTDYKLSRLVTSGIDHFIKLKVTS